MSVNFYRDPTFQRTSLGITDQAIVGATGFATSVIVGRWGSKEELGSYYLMLSLLLFARGIQESATSTPYVVYWSRRAPERRDAYAGSCLTHQLIIAVLTSVAFLFLTIASALDIASRQLFNAAIVLTVFGPALLLKEYLRQLSFAHMKMMAAVRMDIAVMSFQIVGLLVVTIVGVLSAASAYAMAGLACIVACVVWFDVDRIPFWFAWRDVVDDWKSNWSFAKWAVAGQVTGSIVSTVIPWVLSYFHGIEKAGLLAAGFTLVGICNILVIGVANVLAPQAVEALVHEGRNALRSVLRNTSFGLAGVLAAFFALSLLFGEFIVVVIFGPEFGEAGVVMALLALALLINSMAMTASVGLYALEQTKMNFLVDLISTVVALTSGVFLIVALDAIGAAIASVVAAVVAATGKGLVLSRRI